MKNNTLNTVYDYIKNYDLLSVKSTDKNNNIKEFFTTGIKIFRNDLTNIAFYRFCSVPIVPDDFVKFAEICQDGSIFINCGAINYTLTPLKERTEKDTCKHNKFYIDTFIDKNIIDISKVTTENKTVFLPVDFVKIGETTSLQEMKIKTLIDNILEGATEKYQCCRVPAFSVEFEDDYYKINGHIYNIENGEYLNTVLLYDSKTDIKHINPYANFIEFAKSFLN